MDDSAEDDLLPRSQPIQEDMALQRKVWRFERVGWYALVVIVLLTLAGLFSRGPLSTRDISSADGSLRVEYQRFLRNGATDSLTLHLRGGARQLLEVEIAGELLQGFSVQALQPEPLKASSAGAGIRLWLRTDADGQARLYLTLLSTGVGFYDSRIRLADHPPLSISQFIYP
ncbi:hypothetical protein PUP66_16290 [Pseudomonas chlororaphis]|uniref:hypothetical protein n=1 Tax=Pseudomonas chlororaphis TaxID=587753 RepID=UPI000E0C7EE3|nr:hypothetical protein [Pseudomonas chlororaphis]AZD16008.1 hypothetical protein C4K25_3079 [Pseudomonas chlororaphis]WDH44682.1 hypothetical protein PUP66_16290 [Pseudomonas chlororaphis]WDH56529.1 hypothetical protein PUP56_16295 [Pseudomonas chlororaphis]WQE15788.1 hypothetical protein U0007_15105 [Pseudomonas chlororaphis]